MGYKCFRYKIIECQTEDFTRSAAEDYVMAFRVPLNDIPQLQMVLERAYNEHQNQFAVVIYDVTAVVDPNWLSKLMLVMASAAYFRVADKRLLFLDCSGEQKSASVPWVELLSEDVKRTSVTCLPGIENAVNLGTGLKLFFASSDRAFNEQFPLIFSKTATVPALYVEFKRRCNFYQKTLEIEEALNQFKELDTNRTLLLHALVERQEEIELLKVQLEEAHLRAESKKQYENLFQGKDQQQAEFGIHEINRIKKYYRQEYEILPGWYKRFGHIIKVLMGKRSFRSLFNDNVKKYKD